MGTDDIFKKRRELSRKRKHAYKNPKANSYLIVTEGEKTEPLYLEGIKKQIIETVGGRVDIVELPVIDIQGQGSSTRKLVEITEKLVKDARIIYQNIWIVFDKDDFKDFDEAINMAKSKGYKVAWTNPSFEYWLFLHFYYSDSALSREQWNNKLDEIFAERGLGDGKYKKNYKNVYSLVDIDNGVDVAIGNAKRRMSDFREDEDSPSEFCPGTKVHELVEELKEYLDEE